MPYKVVREFEAAVAKYAGAKYGVAVDSCTNALLLCCVRRGVKLVHIPNKTYPGVAYSIIHAGGTVQFIDKGWFGTYRLEPYDITDGALRFCRGMYKGGLHCLSFHGKKRLNIGRGGMILTDNAADRAWLQKARFDGRTGGRPLAQDKFTMLGWNMYMTPEQAARGLVLLSFIADTYQQDLSVSKQGYPDLSKFPVFRRGQP